MVIRVVRSRVAVYLAVAVGGIIVGAGGLAFAASGSGVIHACASKKSGILRLSARCHKRRERPVSWSVQGPQGQSGAQGVPGPQGLQGATGGEGPGASTFTLTLDEGSTAGTVLATTSGVTISARCGNAGQPAIDLSGPTSTDFVHFVGGDIEKDNFGGSGAIEFTNLLTHEFNLNDGDGVLWDGLVRIEGNGSKYSRIDVSGNGGSGNPCTFQGMIIPSG